MWGIHPPIFLIFEIRLVHYLEDPFSKSWVLGRPTVTSNIISRRNVICKNRLFTKKIADFFISFTVRRCQCRPRPPAGALVDHLSAKSMLLKIGATLATPSILLPYGVTRWYFCLMMSVCLFVCPLPLCVLDFFENLICFTKWVELTTFYI